MALMADDGKYLLNQNLVYKVQFEPRFVRFLREYQFATNFHGFMAYIERKECTQQPIAGFQ